MDKQQVKAFAHDFVQENWERVVADIATLCEVDSVEDKAHASEGAPFGPAPREALDRALAVAERLGLPTYDNCDGYMGYAELPGVSGKQVATIAHSDIVPTGEGWHFNPLGATRKDGYLIGRGVMDDKGALVLSIYAAAAIKKLYDEAGVELSHTLRTLIGTNEETGMADVPYYLERHKAPDFLFTPDADFPLIYGEKGHFMGTFSSRELGEGGAVLELSGGTVPNAVPSKAVAVVAAAADTLPETEFVSVAAHDEHTAVLTAHGIGGHASLPEGTRNAIALIAQYLLEHVQLSEAEAEFMKLVHEATRTWDGSSLGIEARDEAFGPLTCVGGVLKLEGGRMTQTVDSRYPTTISGTQIADKLSELAAAYGASFAVGADDEAYIGDPNSAPVRALWDAYHEVTGESAEGYTIGGGTYARHFPRACAFGPNLSRADYPDWVGFEHGPDEGISEKNLQLALETYIVAIDNLMHCEL